MEKKKISGVVMLMILSVLLLIVLQVLWLQAEYKAVAATFRRETNLIFRSTLQHLTDSLFFSQVYILHAEDSFPGFERNLPPGSTRVVNDSLHLSPGRSRRSGMKRSETDTVYTGRGNIAFRSGRHRADSGGMGFYPQGFNAPGSMRSFYLAFSEGYPTDTIKLIFKKALPERYQKLPVVIVERAVDWQRHMWSRPPPEQNDSLPYLTGFVPLGMNKIYAANFGKVRIYLLYSILPQLGFSLFITGLIILSFILVLRSLRTQQRLLEQKNDFIGNMTHELKTPVATVGVALEAMKSFNVLKDPQKAMEYIDMASHELSRLGLMTDNILKTSVFDYKTEIKNNKKIIDLIPIVEKVMASFKVVAERKQINFLFEHQGQAKMLGHEDHLAQMIYNLVDNAFKYAENSAEIKVILDGQAEIISLKVADQGPGIPLEHQNMIFEKFYRIPTKDIHSIKGYGLGLNYVAGVIKSHGGKISIDSKQGSGAVFKVKLPKNL